MNYSPKSTELLDEYTTRIDFIHTRYKEALQRLQVEVDRDLRSLEHYHSELKLAIKEVRENVEKLQREIRNEIDYLGVGV